MARGPGGGQQLTPYLILEGEKIPYILKSPVSIMTWVWYALKIPIMLSQNRFLGHDLEINNT